RNYKTLQSLGLSNDKIASHAQLLGRDPETIERNYRNLEQYFSGADVARYANLLGANPKTINESAEFLGRIGVDYRKKPLLFSTTVKKKKEKLCVFFEEVLGESVEVDALEERARTFFQQHASSSDYSAVLMRSSAYHRTNKDKLRAKYCV
ncbi:hypothetical protein C4580_00005, partial [Candidatus Woesearchaeota archaeon]